MEDPGNLTPRTAIAEYYRSVTPNTIKSERQIHRTYSHEDLAQRPRSNPRTRTPLRNPSPLMIGISIEESTSVFHPNHATVVENDGSSLSSHRTRDSHSRGHSTTGRIITLGASMPVGTTSIHRRMEARRIETMGSSSSAQTPWLSKSRKGAPSHRKIRRWNNDRFQFNDFTHEFNLLTFHHPDTNKREYLMPNAPTTPHKSHSVFTSVAKVHPQIREKIIHGEEVARF